MNKKPQILSSKLVAETKLFAVEELHLRFSNGEERFFERTRGRRGDSVMIVPLLDQDTVLLVREYGVGIEDYFLGLPKGTVEPQENLFEAANRELMEEVGFGAKHFQELKKLANSPAYSQGRMQLLLAKDLYPAKLEGDEPETIEVVPWCLSDLSALIKQDDFMEARSIAALYLIRDLLHG